MLPPPLVKLKVRRRMHAECSFNVCCSERMRSPFLHQHKLYITHIHRSLQCDVGALFIDQAHCMCMLLANITKSTSALEFISI